MTEKEARAEAAHNTARFLSTQSFCPVIRDTCRVDCRCFVKADVEVDRVYGRGGVTIFCKWKVRGAFCSHPQVVANHIKEK